MESAEVIAKVLGPMYVIVAVGLVLRPDTYRRVIKDFLDHPGLGYLGGFMALVFGLLIVVFWPGWEGPLPAVVSVIGVLATIKGAVLLIAPDPVLRFSKSLTVASRRLRIMGGGVLVLGIYLSAAGYL